MFACGLTADDPAIGAATEGGPGSSVPNVTGRKRVFHRLVSHRAGALATHYAIGEGSW